MNNFHVWFRNRILLINLLVFSIFLVGCTAAPPVVTSTPQDIGAIQTAGVATFIAELTSSTPLILPTETLAPTLTPSQTFTLEPTLIPTATSTPVPTIPPYLMLDSSNMAELLPGHIPFFVVAPMSEDPCLFYLKPVLRYPYPLRTGNLIADVTTALDILFSVKDYYINGFPNPLAPSGHSLVEIKVNGYRMDILITGAPARTDDPCINRMMRDQIFKTVYAISDEYGFTEVIIWLDTWNMLYDDYMIGG
jgi:hypothetical protein